MAQDHKGQAKACPTKVGHALAQCRILFPEPGIRQELWGRFGNPAESLVNRPNRHRLKTGAQDTILPHNSWMVSCIPKSMWHQRRAGADTSRAASVYMPDRITRASPFFTVARHSRQPWMSTGLFTSSLESLFLFHPIPHQNKRIGCSGPHWRLGPASMFCEALQNNCLARGSGTF